MNLAFVGLGTMGAPMARHLLAAGHRVTVHNRTREREAPLIALGARPAESPRAAAEAAEAVLVCVSDSPDLEEVILDPERGVAAGCRRGALVVDCSTVAPATARTIAATLADRGVGFVDAPVSGGSEGAERGALAVMCGGTEADVERARPLLAAFSRSIVHVGASGAGQVAKAVNQVLIAGTYQALAEGLLLAEGLDVDPRRVVEAVRGGAAASWVLENRAGNMIDGRYPLGFRARLHRKDLGIALAAAETAGIAMPVARFVAEAEDALIARGFGDEDMSAIARQVRRASGRPDGPRPA